MIEGLILGQNLNPLPHVLPHDLFDVGPITVTSHMFMATVSALLVLVVFGYTASRVKPRGEGIEQYVTKGRLAQMFEAVCTFVREEMARPALGALTDKYIYYIWTVFFFILFCNLLGMVPLGQILFLISGGSEYLSHWGGTATSTLSLNVPLALCSFAAIVYIGIREAGTDFFKHFAPIPFKPLAMVPLAAMLVFLESLSLIIRCGVLAMRLFGTMFAGHLVMAALFGLVFVFADISGVLGFGVGIGALALNIALSLLEVFIALIQAFIFTFLTILFIAEGAVHEHEHEEHPEEFEEEHEPAPEARGAIS